MKACLPTSGVFDMTYLKEDGTRALVPMCAGTMGDTGLERDASPVHWTAGNRTPFLVSWGENDNPFCKAQAPLFAEALRAAPGRVETQVLPILDHFWVTVDQQRPENPYTRTLTAWMRGGGSPRARRSARKAPSVASSPRSLSAVSNARTPPAMKASRSAKAARGSAGGPDTCCCHPPRTMRETVRPGARSIRPPSGVAVRRRRPSR